MIQLLVKDQLSGAEQELDLSNAGELSIDFEALDFRNPTQRKASFSKSFSLPDSKNNNKFFQHYYDIDVSDGATTTIFDARYKAFAEIRIDGLPIVQGYLQLRSYNKTAGVYSVNVFGDEANLFQDIGSQSLRDLLVINGEVDNTLDHVLTPQNVVNSFDGTDITSGSVGAGIVVYPLIDYGTTGAYNFIYSEWATGDFNGITEAEFLNSFNFRPALLIDYLFRRIITQAGYSLVSTNFLNSTQWMRLYMTMGGGSLPITDNINAILACNTGGGTIINTFNFVAGDSTTLILPFNTDNGSAGIGSIPPFTFDVGNHWDTANYQFTAPYDGHYTGELVLNFDTSSAGPSTGYQAFVYFGVVVGTDFSIEDATLPTQTDPYQVSMQWDIDMQAGQTAQAMLQVHIQVAGGTLDLLASGSYFSLTGASSDAGTVIMQSNLPKISQAAFIKDIVQRFNLCIIADRDNPRQLRIEPYMDYLNADNTLLQWTDKIDQSKAEIIEPTHELMSKSIEFRDKKDNDIRNHQFFEQDGEVFGAYIEERYESFVQGTLKNDPVFAPFHIGAITRQDDVSVADDPTFVIAQEFTREGTPATNNSPKLMYYNGTRAQQGPPFFVDNVAVTAFPFFLPYLGQGGNLAPTSPLLYWDNVRPVGLGGVLGSQVSTQGYFSRYWAEFLQPIYSKEARLYTAYVYLEAGDIYNFRFSNKVQVRTSQFRVIKIEGYQPFSGAPCKVTMLKVLDLQKSINLPPDSDDPSDTATCDLVVAGVHVSGEIIFHDKDGTVASATEECCTLNGYSWTGTNCIDPRFVGDNSNTSSGGGAVLDTIKQFKGGTKNKTTKGALRMQPVLGEITTSAKNATAATSGESKHFVYQCTSIGTAVTQANTVGDGVKDGTLTLPINTIARVVIDATSTQINEYGARRLDFGATDFKRFAFVIKNIEGAVSVISTGEITALRTSDSSAVQRNVTVTTTTGSGSKANTTFLKINCIGEHVDSRVAWMLDTNVTYLNFSSAKAFQTDTLYTEDQQNIITEKGDYIEHMAP